MKTSPLDAWIRTKINSAQPALSRADLEDWQLQKINETLALARAKSKYYRGHLAGMPECISKLDDLHQFPFVTPADVRRSPLQFVCVSQDEIERVVTLQSSGTTGEPKRIYFTAEDQELTTDFFDVGMSTMCDVGEKVLILLPGETPGSVGDLLRKGLERQGRVALPYGPVRNPLNALEKMQEYGVDCLVGSPTQVLGLARRWNSNHKPPRTILLSTDYVPGAIVQELERIWGCEVFNHYGATEMGLGGGVECSAHRGYHLREADLYFEIVDPVSAEPVADGEYGEVVFSTLTRRGMPLIRYRMGDRSRFIPGECPCGATLRALECASGRYESFILAKGIVLKLPDFDEALFPTPGLLNFSVSLIGDLESEELVIEAQMLTEMDKSNFIKQALYAIPGIERFKLSIHCRHNPGEPGNILKRIISDKRGQNA